MSFFTKIYQPMLNWPKFSKENLGLFRLMWSTKLLHMQGLGRVSTIWQVHKSEFNRQKCWNCQVERRDQGSNPDPSTCVCEFRWLFVILSIYQKNNASKKKKAHKMKLKPKILFHVQPLRVTNSWKWQCERRK